MKSIFDVAVIGTGTAATGVAIACAKTGKKVVVIDRRPFGGTCALRGCDPKKIMVATAEFADLSRRLGAAHTLDARVRVDWPGLLAFKNTFTDPVPDNKEQMFASAGITNLHGSAKFHSHDTLQVGAERVKARHIVIAVGSELVPLPIEGAEHLATSDDFLDLQQLPERIVLVGGGYIGFEFAHIAALAGAKVTMLNRGVRPLKGFDPDLVGRLLTRSREMGIEVMTGHEVQSIARHQDGFQVTAKHEDKEAVFTADRVFHSGGRVPAVADLELDAGNVAHDGRKLALNEFLQSTSNPNIYAAGDAAPGGIPLTPVAGLEAEVVTSNLLNGNQRTANYHGVPTGVFTVPALGRVGALEAELQGRGVAYRKAHEDARKWHTAARVNESAYAFKVLAGAEDGRILGAHVLGPGTEELINLFALAIQHGLTVEDLRETTMLYPTSGSDLRYMLP